MTVAVCIECGSNKRGALTPCTKCRFIPSDNEDKARSMIVTDHFLARADLDGISKRIRNGQPVTYPQEAVDSYIKLFEENPDPEREAGRFIYGCFAVVALMIIVIAVYYFVA